MIRLLVIIEDSSPTQGLFPALASSADCQCVAKRQPAEAKGALAAGVFDAVLWLPAAIKAEFCQALADFRVAQPLLPVLVVLPMGAEAESPAKLYVAGADSVLGATTDAEAVAAVLQRLAGRSAPASPAPETVPVPGRLNHRAAALSSALEILRDFSQVLGYSLDHRQLTQHFILKLREVVGVNRIAIFLENGPAVGLPGAPAADPGRLVCTAAIGLASDLVECFALSRRSGLGRQLTQQPQILRAGTGTAAPQLDPKIAREFEVLGGQVAIPINDRERTLGVAVLGGRITGGEFSDDELLLVYHLLEELGLAVKNSWLHRQLVGSHELLTRVLDGLTVGALVAGPQSRVLYTNRMLAGFLNRPALQNLELAELPAALARPLHEAIERGVVPEPFFHETEGGDGRIFRATLIVLQAATERPPHTALLLLEDFTQIRSAQRAEIESSNLKLISLIARRFAHEIRNALVPLCTHEQLFDEQIADPEFRASLKTTLSRETQRIQRFTDQMLLLARSDQPATELTPLEDLLRASFEKSRAYSGGAAELEIKSSLPAVILRCNRASLAHAFQEIFLNGLQASEGADGQRRLIVSLNAAHATDGKVELQISVRDSGTGFALESAPRATEPFFTTRNTGVGLGLTIAHRVIEAHHGRLEVHTRTTPGDPDLTIHLPLPR